MRALGGVWRADIARRQSDWNVAITAYEAYLARSPGDFGVRLRLIKTLYSAGRLDGAEKLLNATWAQRPDRAELVALLAEVSRAREASVPVREYDRFREGLIIPASPIPNGLVPPEAVTALVDGRGKSPLAVSETLESLRRSNVSVDAIVVWSADDRLGEKGGLAGAARLATAGPEVFAGKTAVLLLEAGVTLDPEAIGWLRHAIAVTGAVAAYGDDDRRDAIGKANSWSDPALYPAPDPLDMATSPRVPAAILFSGRFETETGPGDRRALLMAAFKVGPVSHIPLLLSSRSGETAIEPLLSSKDAPRTCRESILAIIPTRDEAAALSVMVDGLIAKAADAEKLNIMIVDNGSRAPETLALLKRYVRDGRASVLRVDEPFNWSRLNNLAAAGAEAEILLFANNDMKMLTQGWDDCLRSSLALPGVGAVGARLTYPNGLLQHAGMALGAMDGKPLHEGLGVQGWDEGPLRRWRRNRPAAAVTGAFLGVRSEVFERAGGFNAEDFAVGCNDIDFCLRIRSLGLTVLYIADLELVHWESRSRGHDDSEDRQRRVQSEHQALRRIWGVEAHRDSTRNPHWVNHQTLIFYGLRQPEDAVIRSWIVGSTHSPLRPNRLRKPT